MADSAADMATWNWEGRIWIDSWQDIKWINLRAMPQLLPDGAVQWLGIMTNITHGKSTEAELKQSRAQLAELSFHIETVKEKERSRISREIHDDLGGNLTAIKMTLALLKRRLPAAEKALEEKAAYIDALVDRTIDTVHRIAGDLRPGILDLGLAAALEWQAREFEKQRAVSCEFVCNFRDFQLDSDRSIALFRIAQEALTNISKHAEATRVEIRLFISRRSLLLEVADNGCGTPPSAQRKPKSYGIRGMRERIHALGGSLSIDAAPGGGTLVGVTLPLHSWQPDFSVEDGRD
jgi:two-component system, NarL family, sensor histidine kinase UhpB